MSWVDYVGFLAALTVLATFCMDTILPLRGLAIASNILFIVYGAAGQLYPVLLLHALLLPINISKIVQLIRKNRFDARVAHLLRASGEDGTVDCVPFAVRLSSRNGSLAFNQTTREPRPATLNQLKLWRRSRPHEC
jgi:CRP/FNR family cyclic AMP-dependent transcriptional regulator